MKITSIILIYFIFLNNLIANENQKVSLQLLWKHQFEFAGFYMAKEKGYYKESNLDVDFKEYKFGIDIVKDIENRKSTFAIGYPNIILEKSNGADITLLNAIFQSSPHVFVTLKSSGIDTIEKFKNHSIMIEDDVVKTAPLLSVLFSNKIGLNDIKIVKPTFRIDDLIEKKVDISTAYLSNELYKLNEQNIKYNIFDPKDYGFDFYNDLLFTSTKLTKEDPLLVQNFQNASIKGWKYALEHIDETINVILNKYNTQNKTKEALLYEANILKKLAMKDNIPLGEIDKNKLKRIQDIYSLMGFNSKEINFDQFVFDNNYIYLTKKEKEFIKNTTINISVSKSWKPFSFQNENDDIDGIASDYWQLLAEKTGIHYKTTFYKKFSEQLQSIKNKKNDLVYSTGKTEDRTKYSIFTNEYLKFPISIATLKDENFIDKIDKIINKKIAVGENFTAHKLLKEKYPNIKFTLVNSVRDGLELVNDKKVYAYIDNKPVLLYNINKLGFKDIKVTGNSGLDFSFRIMIRDDYPILKSILNKAIKAITDDEVNNIVKKWENIQYEKGVDYFLIIQILALFIIIGIFFLYRQYILNQTNENLKKVVDEKTKELKQLNKNLELRVEKEVKENTKKSQMLFEQSKMAVMGEMIGNIAHQWKQPLSVINTTASGIQVQLEYDIFSKEEAIKELRSIEQAVAYLSDTIDDFQNFLKPKKDKKLFNIKNVIEKNINMFGKTFSNNNIEIITNLKNIHTLGSSNELLQVTINILNNAKDVLKNMESKERYIFIDLFEDEEKNPTITITDNAKGIDDEIIDNIFQAYYTTKGDEGGTGLGLYMSHQIITNNFKGNLSVENKIYTYRENRYKGASFTIKLPII